MKPLRRRVFLGMVLLLFTAAPAVLGQENPALHFQCWPPALEAASTLGLINSPGNGKLLAASALAARSLEIACQPVFGTTREIAVGFEYVGKLRLGDQRDSVRGTPCNICVVELKKDKTYFVDMKKYGQSIDPYLRLENEKGRHIDSDDDSGAQMLYGGDKYAAMIAQYYGRQPDEPITYRGSAQDARITFKCNQAGKYRIIATTFAVIDSRAGSGYRLQVTEQDAENNHNESIFRATKLAKSYTADKDKLYKALTNYSAALCIHKSANVFRERGAVYTRLGYMQLAKGNLETARKYFRMAKEDDSNAIDLYQDDGYSWYYRGLDYRDLAATGLKLAELVNDEKESEEAFKNYEEAIKNFDEAIRLEKGKALFDPAGLGAHGFFLDDYIRMRGQTYNDRGGACKRRANSARRMADSAQKNGDSKSFAEWDALAKDWNDKALQDYQNAKRNYLEAIEADPNDAANWNAMAWLLATAPFPKLPAAPFRELRNGEKAVEMAEKAVKRAGWGDEAAKGDVKTAEENLDLAMRELTIKKKKDDVSDDELELREWQVAYRAAELKKYKRDLAEYLDTLAAAYARRGDEQRIRGDEQGSRRDFQTACEYQTKAVKFLENLPRGLSDLIDKLQDKWQLQLPEKGQTTAYVRALNFDPEERQQLTNDLQQLSGRRDRYCAEHPRPWTENGDQVSPP